MCKITELNIVKLQIFPYLITHIFNVRGFQIVICSYLFIQGVMC